MLLPAVDCQQQVGDQTTNGLYHETVFAPGNQVVHFEMAFPPTEEGLYVPAQLIDLGNFFSCQVISVGGYPVLRAVYTVNNKAKLFLSLVILLVPICTIRS
jgi:hypothetical protein